MEPNDKNPQEMKPGGADKKSPDPPQIEEETGKKLAEQQDRAQQTGDINKQSQLEKDKERERNVEKYKGANTEHKTREEDEESEEPKG